MDYNRLSEHFDGNGQTYYFNSERCMWAFREDPYRYTDPNYRWPGWRGPGKKGRTKQ